MSTLRRGEDLVGLPASGPQAIDGQRESRLDALGSAPANAAVRKMRSLPSRMRRPDRHFRSTTSRINLGHSAFIALRHAIRSASVRAAFSATIQR